MLAHLSRRSVVFQPRVQVALLQTRFLSGETASTEEVVKRKKRKPMTPELKAAAKMRLMKETETTPALESIVGSKTIARPLALKKVWEFISEKNLKLDKEVKVEGGLEKLLVPKNVKLGKGVTEGTKTLTASQVMSLISPHLKSKENDLSWYRG